MTAVADDELTSSATPPPDDVEPEAREATARRLSVPMPADRALAWGGAALLGLVTFFLRLYNLAFPNRLQFDEVYYVPEANQYLNYGFEENRNYYFIVHPPFGKAMIAVGEWLFGYTPFGWRFAGVVVGSLAVLMFTMLARRMTRSTFLGFVGGILLACDGFSFALSRLAILDVFVQFWVLAGFVCLVRDRDVYRDRLAAAIRRGAAYDRWPPRVGVRWWRLAAGVCVGLSCGVKWSGVYFIVAFALLSVVWDWSAHRALGLRHPLSATFRRTLPGAFWELGVVPVLAYLATWIGWFAGESAQGRHWADDRATDFPWIPAAIRSMWHMQGEWLKFHNGLDSPHPYESNPWSWLVTARPLLFTNDPVTLADGSRGFRVLTMVGTPPLFWAFVPAALWMVWWLVSRRDWRAFAVLVGIAAGWGTWLFNTDRTMFMFYIAPAVPFFVLAIVFVLGDVLGPKDASETRRQWGLAVVAFYVAVVVVIFGWFYPVYTGMEISEAAKQARLWFPTWG